LATLFQKELLTILFDFLGDPVLEMCKKFEELEHDIFKMRFSCLPDGYHNIPFFKGWYEKCSRCEHGVNFFYVRGDSSASNNAMRLNPLEGFDRASYSIVRFESMYAVVRALISDDFIRKMNKPVKSGLRWEGECKNIEDVGEQDRVFNCRFEDTYTYYALGEYDPRTGKYICEPTYNNNNDRYTQTTHILNKYTTPQELLGRFIDAKGKVECRVIE